MNKPLSDARLHFVWPDQSPLASVLPVILQTENWERVVAPGQRVAEVAASTPVTAFAVVPGSVPLVAQLNPNSGGTMVMPFPATSVLADLPISEPPRHLRGSIAFGIDTWSNVAKSMTGTRELSISRRGDELVVAPQFRGELVSVPSRLVVASRSTPTRVVAVPALGPEEAAIVDLATERPFGDRPALTPSDPRSRLLLAYLGTGQYEIARVLAIHFAAALGEQRTLSWSEPSLAQLLIGYSLAADEDRTLTAWCRRTQADQWLGVDGIILAASAAWEEQHPREAARLLTRAEQMGSPVMSLGLEIAVRLAYSLLAEEAQSDALNRLVTAYSVLSTTSDPIADTVTTPTSHRRPVSLEGRGWAVRARWALTYLAVRQQMPHVVRSAAAKTIDVVLGQPISRDSGQSAAKTVDVLENPPAASDSRQSTLHFGAAMNPRLFAYFAFALVGSWLVVVAAVVAVALNNNGDWERLVAPLGILEAAVFTLLGVAISDTRRGNQDEEHARLLSQVEMSEHRLRDVQEAAMRGRALAAALQADSGGEPSFDVIRHARLSRGMFGELVVPLADSYEQPASPELPD